MPTSPPSSIAPKTNTPLRQPPRDYAPEGSEAYFEIPQGPDAGKRLFYYDHSIAGGGPTVLLVHGNPECSYTYRHLRDRLISRGVPCRLIAMDHVGFGLSDQASFEMVDMHHAANLRQLVAALDLRDITLVVHDWGGPIGIGSVIDEPDRVANLVVLNTTVFPMPADGITYENYPVSWLPWCQTPHWIPDALWPAVGGFIVPNAHPQGTLPFLAGMGWALAQEAVGLFGRDPESAESVFAGQLRSPANARSSKRHVLQTPVWGHGYRYDDPTLGPQDNHAFYANMQQKIGREWGPEGRHVGAAGFFGQWDACGKISVVRQWQEALPQLRGHTEVYEDVGHFVEEYKGPEIADAIARLLAG